MNIRPGGNFSAPVFTENAQGVPTAADALPTAFVFRNGAKDLTVPVAVAPIAGEVGMYAVTGAIPANYLTGDVVQIIVKAVVGGQVMPIVATEIAVQSLLRRQTFNPVTSSLQFQEDDGQTPLAGLPSLVLQVDANSNITKR